MKSSLRLVAAFLSGLLFAVGLGIGGMTQPSKVVGFLDVTGDWDPSLALVMGGAFTVNFLTYRAIFKMESPWLAERFGIPTRRDLNARLVGGAALFGLGWGLAGYCPGPGIVASATGTTTALIFTGSMVVGMTLFRYLDPYLIRRRQRTVIRARQPKRA
jgi:uncharacterized membrane protein YedE/YeeE